MIECRPILPEEADAYLQLLCTVFEIDAVRVRGVFYQEPLFDLNRKWALFAEGKMRAILTTVPLEFGWGNALGIAGVATLPESRRQGYADQLIQTAVHAGEVGGESAAFLFAKDPRVYERCGFQILDEVVQAPLEWHPLPDSHVLLTFPEIESCYNDWALGEDNRLRRCTKRWQYWQWNLRLCHQQGQGYVCQEGGLVREAVNISPRKHIETTEPCTWNGLKSVLAKSGLPDEGSIHQMYFMGRGRIQPPEMFLTDQF